MDTYTLLVAHMTDTVTLVNLLNKITHQGKVKVIATLNTTFNEEKKIITYSGGNYHFSLMPENRTSSNWPVRNTVFIDGKNKISFKHYNITCYNDSLYRCEDYGFNLNNTLESPVIIEVCGKRFLYANVQYWCNGIGCGCYLTFIYDLDKHKPTFIENYRIPYSGFFISDFNNDHNPDLLVISRTLEQKMKGFDFDEFNLRLTPFQYHHGTFIPYFDTLYQRTYGYELYSFTNLYHHSYHDSLIYSISSNNWFRE
ncbi:MAG: hypothetical protein RLZZ367_2365 [Bacteroidota bacterium]